MMVLGLVLLSCLGGSGVAAQTGKVDLVLEPATVTAKRGDTLQVTIKAIPSQKFSFFGMDVFLDFNPSFLQVTQVRPGTVLNEVILNQRNNAAGQIAFTAVISPYDQQSPDTPFTVATITCQIKPDATGSGNITFQTVMPRQTMVASSGNSVTGSLTGAAVSLEAPPAPVPPVTLPTPAPPTPKPAEFTIGPLSITPAEVKTGEKLTISTTITNTGDVAGKKTITLKINGAAVETREVSVDANKSTTVSFTVARPQAASYNVELDGQTGKFTVVAAAAPTPTTPPPSPPTSLPQPAQLKTSTLTVTPAEVKSGEKVTISATVTNTGDVAGKKTITLKINDAAVETREVSVDAKKSTTVSFAVTRAQAGSYNVDVDGQTGKFTVVAASSPAVPTPPPPPPPGSAGPAWWIWLIIGLAVAGVVTLFMLRRGSSY